jgi:hypothetical protein
MRSNGSDKGAVLFGQALTILRVSRGLSRIQLAEAGGVTPVSLGHYERDHCRPREGALSRIPGSARPPARSHRPGAGVRAAPGQ